MQRRVVFGLVLLTASALELRMAAAKKPKEKHFIASSSCGQYPDCRDEAVCWAKRERCKCTRDDAHQTCAIHACRKDKSCP